MGDGSWDNSGVPLSKKGMPLWGKILTGCGLVLLLLLGSCVGLACWGIHRVGSLADKTWGEMDRSVRGLKTPEGARDLYRANPGLAENYPTEEDFLKAAEGWRSNLGEFPSRRPNLRDLMQEQKVGGHFTVSTQNHTTRIEYQIPKGGRLYLQMESERLVDLRVE